MSHHSRVMIKHPIRERRLEIAENKDMVKWLTYNFS